MKNVNYTDRERYASHGERAWQAGYDARYEGKPKWPPSHFASHTSPLAQRWMAGWDLANEELS